MKLKINGTYEKVGFWSFMKCSFLTQFILTVLLYVVITIVLIIFNILKY